MLYRNLLSSAIISILLLTLIPLSSAKIAIGGTPLPKKPCEGIPFPYNLRCILENAQNFDVWSSKNSIYFEANTPYTFYIEIDDEYYLEDLTMRVVGVENPNRYDCFECGYGAVRQCEQVCIQNGGKYYFPSEGTPCSNRCGRVTSYLPSYTKLKSGDNVLFNYPTDKPEYTIQLKDIANLFPECESAYKMWMNCKLGVGECDPMHLYRTCRIPLTVVSSDKGAIHLKLVSYKSSSFAPAPTITTTTQAVKTTTTICNKACSEWSSCSNEIQERTCYYTDCSPYTEKKTCLVQTNSVTTTTVVFTTTTELFQDQTTQSVTTTAKIPTTTTYEPVSYDFIDITEENIINLRNQNIFQRLWEWIRGLFT